MWIKRKYLGVALAFAVIVITFFSLVSPFHVQSQGELQEEENQESAEAAPEEENQGILGESEESTEVVSTEESGGFTEETSTEESGDSAEEESTEEGEGSTEEMSTEESEGSTEEESTEEIEGSTGEESTEGSEDSTEEESTEGSEGSTEEESTEGSEGSTEEESTEGSEGSTEEESTEGSEDSTEEESTEEIEGSTEETSTEEKPAGGSGESTEEIEGSTEEPSTENRPTEEIEDSTEELPTEAPWDFTKKSLDDDPEFLKIMHGIARLGTERMTLEEQCAEIGLIIDANGYIVACDEELLPEELWIPEGVQGISFGDPGVFQRNEKLKKVYLPDSIVSIPYGAFQFCSNLEQIEFGDRLEHIGSAAFAYTGLTEVRIPDSVTFLGGDAFEECLSLREATLPAGINNIADDLFFGCTSLEKVTIPDTIELIHQNAFFGCALRELTLPRGLLDIYPSAFAYCENLVSVTIPDNIAVIRYRVFVGCKSLEEVILPDTLLIIDEGAFGGCPSLKSLTLPENIQAMGDGAFLGSTVENITIDNIIDTNASAPNAFKDAIVKNFQINSNTAIEFFADKILTSGNLQASGDMKVTVGDGVSILPARAFDNPGITGITLSDTLLKIKSDAFNGCGITSVTIPESVTEIEEYAFRNAKLEELTLAPSGLITLNIGVFGDSGIKTIRIENDNAVNSALETNTLLPANVTVVLGKDTTYIPLLSSASARNIEKLIINSESLPGGFQGNALQEAAALDTLELNTNVAVAALFGSQADADKLQLYTGVSLTLGGNLEVVSAGAFQENSKILDVHLGAGVKRIEKDAFARCALPGGFFIGEGSALQFIGEGAFRESGLQGEFTIPGSVAQIGENAFSGSQGLSVVTIEIGALSILPDGMFKNCDALKTANLPYHLTEIGSEAFADCRNLEFVGIPKRLRKIGQEAFRGCKMMSVELPADIIEIGSGAFKESALEWVYFQMTNREASVAEDIFADASRLNKFVLETNESIECLFGGRGIAFPVSGTEVILGSGVTRIVSIASPTSGYVTALTVLSDRIEVVNAAAIRETFIDTISISNQGALDGMFGAAAGLELPMDHTEIILGSGITEIPEHAFEGRTQLSNIELPDSLIKIGEYAFANCRGLTEIKIPEGTTEIERSAFSGSTKLTEVKIPEGLETIGEFAFSDCTALGSIRIPAGVRVVNPFAFSGCTQMSQLTISSEAEIKTSAFRRCPIKKLTVNLQSGEDILSMADDVKERVRAAGGDLALLNNVTVFADKKETDLTSILPSWYIANDYVDQYASMPDDELLKKAFDDPKSADLVSVGTGGTVAFESFVDFYGERESNGWGLYSEELVLELDEIMDEVLGGTQQRSNALKGDVIVEEKNSARK